MLDHAVFPEGRREVEAEVAGLIVRFRPLLTKMDRNIFLDVCTMVDGNRHPLLCVCGGVANLLKQTIRQGPGEPQLNDLQAFHESLPFRATA